MKKTLSVILPFAIIIVLSLGAFVLRTLEDNGIIDNIAVGENKEEITPESGFGADFLNAFAEFRADIQYTLKNYFPFMSATTQFYKNTLSTINRPTALIYNHFTNTAPVVNEPDAPTVVNEYIGMGAADRYYRTTVTYPDGRSVEFIEAFVANLTEDQKQERTEKSLEFANDLIRANDKVNICIYVGANLEFSPLVDEFYSSEDSSYKYLEYYLDGLDKRAKSSAFFPETIDERISNYYLTDHHWREDGFYKAYTEIIGLLRENAPEILPAYEYKEKIHLEGSEFYGSYARNNAIADLYDDFYVLDYDLPAHISSPGYSIDALVEKYLNTPDTSTNHNIYGSIYPRLKSVSFPENKTGRNLLVIGDSYAQAIMEPLAASFDNTYYYCVANSYGGGFNYNQVIEEYGITDVLYMQFGTRMIFDATNDAKLDKIDLSPLSGTEG